MAAGDGRRHPVAAGDAVLWDRGEEHESGADETAMVAIVVQADALRPADAAD